MGAAVQSQSGESSKRPRRISVVDTQPKCNHQQFAVALADKCSLTTVRGLHFGAQGVTKEDVLESVSSLELQNFLPRSQAGLLEFVATCDDCVAACRARLAERVEEDFARLGNCPSVPTLVAHATYVGLIPAEERPHLENCTLCKSFREAIAQSAVARTTKQEAAPAEEISQPDEAEAPQAAAA